MKNDSMGALGLRLPLVMLRGRFFFVLHPQAVSFTQLQSSLRYSCLGRVTAFRV